MYGIFFVNHLSRIAPQQPVHNKIQGTLGSVQYQTKSQSNRISGLPLAHSLQHCARGHKDKQFVLKIFDTHEHPPRFSLSKVYMEILRDCRPKAIYLTRQSGTNLAVIYATSELAGGLRPPNQSKSSTSIVRAFSSPSFTALRKAIL